MPEPPFELQKLVTVGTYTFPWEAQVARGRLEAEGIAALIADEHTIRMVALNSAIGGIQVRVREDEAGRAVEVLRRHTPLPEIYLVPDPGPAAASHPAAAPVAPLDVPLVTAARFHTVWEAHLARTLLESEGIPACVLEERLPAVNLLSSALRAANRLEVRGADAARAAEILALAMRGPAGKP
jgi:hypothetical protein